MTDIEDDALKGLVATLLLADKVRILTGQDDWSTYPLPLIGLQSMVLSDGPSGVRGATWDERNRSLNLPSASALSSSWDIGLAARYGAVAGAEAREKGVHVVLGPTINLHRSPLGGRHFEAYSEDPLLTAELAAAYVSGAQAQGVAATPKHYVANDFESERYRVDVQVGGRALRELYLLAFEKAVVDAGCWAVMSAYNSVNGTTATENDLLSEPLNGEWGFDGVVVSDWTAVRSIESARHPQDLAMPGPSGAWGPALESAVLRGEVTEASIDRKVTRLLRLAARVGALNGYASTPVGSIEDGVAFARLASAEGSVLVRNQSLLPLDPGSLNRVAVIGENARHARMQGGGSATVMPGPVVNPLVGLVEALPQADVVHSLGATVRSGFAEFDASSMVNPVSGQPGAQVRYLDVEGHELMSEERFASALVSGGGESAVPGCEQITLSTLWTPSTSGAVSLGFAQPGHGRLRVEGDLVLDDVVPEVGRDQIDAFFAPDYRTAVVDVVAGNRYLLEFEFEPGEAIDGVYGSFAVTFGMVAPSFDEDELIREAAEVARDCDVVVVVVGTNSQVECEGFDRTDLRLPGRQDDLVSAVAAVNARTVVVVNAGAPVEMPWREDVASILLTWFGGQEFGHALTDVLLGLVEPGGRLPTTWPVALADVPVLDVKPVDGVVRYDEGIHIGYRAWLLAGKQPAYPFGFGLGYTTWNLGAAEVGADQDTAEVSCIVTNTGDRGGKQVIQVYADRPDSAVDRPVRWLVGFEVVRLGPGESTTVRISVPGRGLAYWDGEWIMEPGRFNLQVGTSSVSLRKAGSVLVDESGVL